MKYTVWERKRLWFGYIIVADLINRFQIIIFCANVIRPSTGYWFVEFCFDAVEDEPAKVSAADKSAMITRDSQSIPTRFPASRWALKKDVQ